MPPLGRPHLATLSFSPSAPLADPPCLICMAAADACAEGDTVGVGGWLATSSSIVWFAETWHMQDLRKAWPFLSKGAQAYISSSEALAQLILLQAAYYRLHHKHTSFCLPSGSDNTAPASESLPSPRRGLGTPPRSDDPGVSHSGQIERLGRRPEPQSA